MSKKAKSWYAWRDANGNGNIFRTWAECEADCKGKPGEKHKGFETKEEAWAFAYPGVPMPADSVQEQQANLETLQPLSTVTDVQSAALVHPFHIDASRISHVEPSDQVNRFCAEYDFDHLSKDQRRAVQSVNGKVLLFAVPGSGKTTVLIARVGYMVHTCHIPPASIVSLTFTKASAAEMGERYQKRFPSDPVYPEFRTIHSFAFSVIIPLLRSVGYPIPWHMINETYSTQENDEQKKRSYEAIIFSEINSGLEQIGKELNEKKTVLLHGRKDREALRTAITGIKNNRLSAEQLRNKTIHLSSGQDLPVDRAYNLYQELCRKYHCMDFDDMLSYALDGLQSHPEALSRLHDQYRYWSIDESQDNSPLQHDLLQLLVGESGNLFMVGDDDQSIYAFRGARPRLFQQFGMESDVTVLTMGSNYRSASGIVKTAESFIKTNTTHQEKQMQAAKNEAGCIRFIYDLHTEKHQYAKIIETARTCSEQGLELAVLYKENISALPVMFWLEKHGIPFFTAAKLTELLQSTFVQRILNLLRFVVRQNSYHLCTRVRTDLHLHPADDVVSQWKKACKAAPDRNVLDVLDEIDQDDYSSITQLLNDAANAAPYDAICKLIKELGIVPNSQNERMQVNAILSTSALYDSIPEMLSAIEEMKRKLNDTGDEEDDGEAVLPVSESEIYNSTGHTVTLSTMHSAKGLEFDHVMIIDYLAPPEIPDNPMQLTFNDPEEASRLFYVAVTRAKQTLDILTVQAYHGRSEEPHPFICLYASICESEESLTEYPSTVPEATDCKQIRIYGKYYGVSSGRVPGVYTTWEDTKQQVDRFSGQQYKSFQTWEEAAQYVYPKGVPDQAKPVDTSIFRQYLVTSPTLRANWPWDIHRCVTEGILALLHTDNLMSLDQATRNKLKISYLDSHADAYDYSGMRALAYTVSYLPPNYYKIWTPLWKLLEKKRLPYTARILELGAGPGTSGLALLDFYSKLAAANPLFQFSLTYTAVERETAFEEIFETLMNSMISQLPVNLHVSIELIHADAFDYINRIQAAAYDLILESNMLNPDEKTSFNALTKLSEGFARCLNEHGLVILIEPGRQEQLPLLKMAVSHNDLKPFAKPEITSVDTTSITLMDQCLKAGVRVKELKQHWYSFIIAERKSL